MRETKELNLEKMRKERGYTQQQLADLCYVDRTTISRIESGENKPSVPVAKMLGKTLECDWTLFYEE